MTTQRPRPARVVNLKQNIRHHIDSELRIQHQPPQRHRIAQFTHPAREHGRHLGTKTTWHLEVIPKTQSIAQTHDGKIQNQNQTLQRTDKVSNATAVSSEKRSSNTGHYCAGSGFNAQLRTIPNIRARSTNAPARHALRCSAVIAKRQSK